MQHFLQLFVDVIKICIIEITDLKLTECYTNHLVLDGHYDGEFKCTEVLPLCVYDRNLDQHNW